MDEVLRQVGPVGLVVLVLSLPVIVARLLPILLRRPARWVWDWFQARMDTQAEPDPAAQALALQIQRERLCASLDRIEVLITHDDWMSATRQMGNRLARRRLAYEIRQLPDAPSMVRKEPWSEAARSPRRRSGFGDDTAAPSIEFLEIGLRH